MRAFATLALVLLTACAPPRTKYLDTAVDAGRWIRSTAIVDEHGLAWPADPSDPKSISSSLYSGSSGVVLFFLELSRATGDPSWLEDAKRGADRLIATLPDHIEGEACGLYTGVAGIGFVLEEVHRATGDARYRAGAELCVRLIEQAMRETERTASWSTTNDIISGSAGIGLFLLYASGRMNDPRAMECAWKTGCGLLDRARHMKLGTWPSWRMDENSAREMPNFSHGAAGIAYFLTRLLQEDKVHAWRRVEIDEYGLGSVENLRAIADRSDGGLRVCHDDADGHDLYYLGWCHGPVGTARAFFARRFLDEALFCGESLIASGIPEQRTPGFWNNVGQCCGSAGVAEFALDSYAVTRDPKWRIFARRLADDVLARSTRDGHGLRWIQAEHRVKPELLVAQTGWMQGAAGVGHMLLRMDAVDRHRKL